MIKKYILAIDQGTSSSRAILFDRNRNAVNAEQVEYELIYPKPGLVEQDPEVIWNSQLSAIKRVIANSKINPSEIVSIGITNQRETTIVWDKNTGKAVYNAIIWQDTRTADLCNSLKDKGLGKEIVEKTGLIPDPYFSATKIQWILDNVNGARKKADNGDLLFGTVDTWLLWKLSKGKLHYTDVSNASRTMIFDINKLEWSNDLLDLFDIPVNILPEVKETSAIYGNIDSSIIGCEIPVGAMVGDQQAALFGQGCFSPGSVKNTYGTGCFMLMNTGSEPVISKSGLLSTIAWSINNKIEYALEGSVFIAGAAIQWLRDGLKLIASSSESEEIAINLPDNHGVYFVPAFTGLGAPYWNMDARGSITGLTRSSNSGHIVRAALESMAYQTKDVLNAMVKDAGIKFSEINVDGGASDNNFLMQFQSDILNTKIIRPKFIESTALGAALLAGIATGFWTIDEIKYTKPDSEEFLPKMSLKERTLLYKGWQDAVKKTLA